MSLNPSADSAAEGVRPADDGGDITLRDLVRLLRRRWRLLVAGPLVAGLLALGATYLVAPLFTARTSFLPPQQQQSAAMATLASLGALGSLAAGGAGLRSPVDQYVALLQSHSVSLRIIERFDLRSVYDEELLVDTRDKLARNVRIAAGRKDGLITVEVEDRDPQRAASIANQYVDELRRVTGELALTEAQQRRAFFEAQLARTRDQLVRAQTALESSGIGQGAIKAEPRAAAERFARLQAEVTAAEVRIQTLRTSLVDSAPEMQQRLAQLAALREQLARAEQPAAQGSADYIGRFREFKYQETLFELFARQYEAARLDESREGALIQVVDVALPPERKSWPRRGLTAVLVTAGTLLSMIVWLVLSQLWRQDAERSEPSSPS
jgi:uncharacterized protein involved in exopolysaccharide biosynthesis